MKFYIPLLLFCITQPCLSQTTNKYSSDVQSVDSIITALYDVISGEGGAPRDWERFKYLFSHEGRLIPTFTNKEGATGLRVLSPNDYSTMFSSRVTTGFYENELHRVTESYGNIVHVFSTYETKEKKDGAATARGINSIQLLKADDRYYIVSIFWSSETPENPLPENYLRK